MNRKNRRRDSPYSDKWEFEFDKVVMGLGLVAIAANIVIFSVVIWAIIELVQWVTAK